MEKVNGIEIRECADLGPVIARADHRDGAIEVNAAIFYGLPPMVQEFVLCHEVCHLKYGEHDEGRTNLLASNLFLGRARNDADRKRRADFLAYMDGKEYSNWASIVVAAVSAAFSIGTTVYGIVKQRNAGYYSWDDDTRRSNVRVMLTTAFEESRKTSQQSAQDLFWAQLQQYDVKDNGYAQFASRSENAWVKQLVAQYEKKYGFKFDAVTPIDWTAFTATKVAIGAVVGVAVFLLARKIIKNK